MTLWSIFWRTFAQLELAVVGAAQVMDWSTDGGQLAVNADKLGALTIMAVLGGLGATLWAWATTPAGTPLEKALRSAAEAAAAGIATLAVNSVLDIVSLGAVLAPILVGVVLAFGVTFFQNQGEVPTPPSSG